MALLRLRWLTMTATKSAEGVYHGTLNQTHGPAFNAQPFNPALVSPIAVGDATLTFTDANNGSFAYTVNGVSQTKNLVRQVFGPVPTCVFGASPTSHSPPTIRTSGTPRRRSRKPVGA